MNGYKYKMEKVLEYRSQLEKKKVEDYARVNMTLEEQKDRLAELKDEYGGKNRDQETGIHEMKMQFLYKEKLRRDMYYQEVKIQDTEHKVNDARDILIEARKDRKIMEILKDKDKTQYIQEVNLKEQKELDDISIMKFASQG